MSGTCKHCGYCNMHDQHCPLIEAGKEMFEVLELCLESIEELDYPALTATIKKVIAKAEGAVE